MSNLSNRVQKSKSLKFNFIPGLSNPAYGTTSHDHTHHYQVFLSKARETIAIGDKVISHDTITVKCVQCHKRVGNCKGNSNGTICYHGLGAIRHHLSLKHSNIAFCQDIFDAIKLRKPGQSLVKIVSVQGQAILWGVVGKQQNFSDRVELMRGTKEESEGID